jgi:hypothetical protein
MCRRSQSVMTPSPQHANRLLSSGSMVNACTLQGMLTGVAVVATEPRRVSYNRRKRPATPARMRYSEEGQNERAVMVSAAAAWKCTRVLEE